MVVIRYVKLSPFPGLSDPEVRALVRHNILQPSEPIDIVDGDQTEKIIHIFLGAAAMALFIVLLALVLGAFYCRSWKRWAIILFTFAL